MAVVYEPGRLQAGLMLQNDIDPAVYVNIKLKKNICHKAIIVLLDVSYSINCNL